MNKLCDLCNEPVVSGQPRFGMPGKGDASGAPFGYERHWSCHEKAYGRPAAAFTPSRPSAPSLPPARAVLAPKVSKGPYNQSSNAGREFKVLRKESAIGKSRVYIECPFCFQRFWAYVWSISGGGKKCTNCGAIHASFGLAYPIEGNEDIGA